MSIESHEGLLWLVQKFRPIPFANQQGRTSKTNHNLPDRIFPRFREFAWFYLWPPYQLLFPIFLPKNLRMTRQLHLPRSFNCFWLFKHTVLTQAHVVAPSPWHYCKIIQSSQSLWWLQQSHDNWLQAVLESTQWWLEAMTLSVSSCEWAANGVDLAKLREPLNNFKKILIPQP